MLGSLKKFTQDGHTIVCEFLEGIGVVDVISSGIINFYIPPFIGSTQHILSRNDRSFSIENLQYQPCPLCVSQTKDCIVITTGELYVEIGTSFVTDIFVQESSGKRGELICADYRARREPFKRRGGNEALASEEGHITQKESEYPVYVSKTMTKDICFYGLGERTGALNKKGYHYKNWNTDNPAPHTESFEQLYKSIPFFIALQNKKAYGIFFDNTFETHFDMGKENPAYYYFAAVDGALDYYFIYGHEIATVISRYTDLTGKMPLPQQWTLGFQQSRWSYTPASRVMEVAAHFRRHKIPCDTIHLDIDYMDGYRVFTWGKEFLGADFKTPKEFIDALRKLGFKVVTIIDPGVKKDKGYAVYDEGIENRYFATDRDDVVYVNRVWPGDSVYPDFTNTKVRTWWAEKQKLLTDAGVAGIWNDMNEPASFNGPLPPDVMCNKDGKAMAHNEWHNVYGSLMSKATFSGIKNATGKRPYVITRACFAGAQKNTTVWTGDNHSTWEHLRMSIPMLQNLSMSGLPFCGADIGGFSSDCSGELLSRWIQVGAFSPFCRNHSAMGTRSQEAWEFDDETQCINRKYIELRYTLIPYFYDSFKDCETSGSPVLKPLVCNYQNDERTYNCNDEFLCGNDILVAPVLDQGVSERAVYFPKGDNWVDFWTEERHRGGTSTLKTATVDICPIYIKEGAIIPRYEVQQYIGEKEQSVLQLDVYEHSVKEIKSIYIHYQDDGESYDYKDGVYNEYSISLTGKTLSVQKIHSGYDKSYTALLCRLHCLDGQVSEKTDSFVQGCVHFMF